VVFANALFAFVHALLAAKEVIYAKVLTAAIFVFCVVLIVPSALAFPNAANARVLIATVFAPATFAVAKACCEKLADSAAVF